MSTEPATRAESLEALRALGHGGRQPEVPLLDPGLRVRPLEDILDRLLALHACMAAAYGLDAAVALEWAEREGVSGSLSGGERAFLEGRREDARKALQQRVEALYALAWTTRHQEMLLPNVRAAQTFAGLLPRPDRDDARAFRERARERPPGRVLQALDTYRVLHALRATCQEQAVDAPRELISQGDLTQRLRALTWCTSEAEWEAIRLG